LLLPIEQWTIIPDRNQMEQSSIVDRQNFALTLGLAWVELSPRGQMQHLTSQRGQVRFQKGSKTAEEPVATKPEIASFAGGGTCCPSKRHASNLRSAVLVALAALAAGIIRRALLHSSSPSRALRYE
jgi:hypothetical protein